MNRQRVAIIGSTGQLGSDLVSILKSSGSFDVIPLRHENADVTDAKSVRAALLDHRPEIVVNSAAFVRVDDCEDHSEEAFRVNAVGAFNVASSCAELTALCVYISTDYVFDGTKESPYVESDAPNPINVYGTAKLAGELLVRQAAPRWLIVRMAGLFGKTGARGKGGNFVETIIAKAKKGEPLRIVDDIRMSPTYTRDAAEGLLGLLKSGCEGVVHLTNAGNCTWYEFATKILQLAGSPACVNPVNTAQYPTKARRPVNSALVSARAQAFLNQPLRPWPQALKAYLVEKGHLVHSAERCP